MVRREGSGGVLPAPYGPVTGKIKPDGIRDAGTEECDAFMASTDSGGGSGLPVAQIMPGVIFEDQPCPDDAQGSGGR